MALHRSIFSFWKDPNLLQALGRCRGSRRVVLKAAPFIGDQRGVLLKTLCKPTFAVRSHDKEFEA